MESNPEDERTVSCQHRLLARSGVGGVTVCRGCGQVHLELQNLSLRFEAAGFRELAGMLAFAQQRLEGRAEAAAAGGKARRGLH